MYQINRRLINEKEISENKREEAIYNKIKFNGN